MTPALWTPFLVLAAIGLALSVVAHGAALLELPQPLGSATWLLHIGIFVVGVPVVLAANRLNADFKQKDLWKATLRGCPYWMRVMAFGFFWYALANFLLFVAATLPRGARAEGDAKSLSEQGFSGHWMAFYSIGVAVLYSAIVVSRTDPARRCPGGHPVSPSAAYCEACGVRVPDPEAAPPGNDQS